MNNEPPSPAGQSERLRVSQIRSAAPVDDGESLLLTLEIGGGERRVDVLLPHELGPPLQRLVGIVGTQAAAKRAEAGVHKTRVTAERVARIELLLPTPDGSALVQLATVNGYPIAFTLPHALIAELAERLAEQVPIADPHMKH